MNLCSIGYGGGGGNYGGGYNGGGGGGGGGGYGGKILEKFLTNYEYQHLFAKYSYNLLTITS